MRLQRPGGAPFAAVTIALVAILSGVPQALRSAVEPEHRCRCPAGSHVCSCPRCAAQAGSAAKPRCHGAAGADAAVARARPPCHGGEPRPPAEGDRSPPSRAPCVSARCGDEGLIATAPAGVEPFLFVNQRLRLPGGRPEEFPAPARPAAADPAAPEPPPPRA